MPFFPEYEQFDGLGLAELVAKGEMSADELLDAAIERSFRHNPSLNAIIHLFEARARVEIKNGLPDGPFKGVPFLLKDLISAYAGEPLTMGCRAMADYVPEEDSELVKRYKASGLSIFGKTNLPEFGLVITTEPKLHGPAHNPHKQGYSTGGSSGGSAASVASGIVPMANADDGGGSIRLPAAWCGVIGLKPSRGRTPTGPDFGELWDGAVGQHIVSRSVRDTAAMLDCTAGPEFGAVYHTAPPKDSFLKAASEDPKPLRIALSRDPLVPETFVHREVLDALEETGKRLEDLGHKVEYVDPKVDKEMMWKCFIVVVAGHTAALQRLIRDERGSQAVRRFEPATKNLAMIGRSLSARDFVLAKMFWHEVSVAMDTLFHEHDLMLSPTVPTTAERHGILPPTRFEEIMLEVGSHFNIGRWAFASGMVRKLGLPVLQKMAYCIMGNMAGLPGISLPTHQSQSGLPIGMQFTAPMGDEETLLSLAGQMERAKYFDSGRAL